MIFLSGMTFDLTHPHDRWESIRGARSRLSLNPAIFSDVKVCLAPPQVPSKSRPQQPSKRRPPLRGSARAKASVFHTTQLLLPKSVSTRLSSPSSRFFRKAALDDACAGVSSFRDNGERAGQERWAPLNTPEEGLHLIRLLGQRAAHRWGYDSGWCLWSFHLTKLTESIINNIIKALIKQECLH